MGEEDEYLTADKVSSALIEADDQTKLRIERRLGILSFAGMDAGDIRNEVWIKVFDGRLKCPIDVDPVAFFLMSARSVVTQRYDQEKRSREGIAKMQADPTTAQPSASSDPETMLIDTNRYEHISQFVYDNFANDAEALLFIEKRLQGETPTEIKQATGWSDTQIETIRRRVARRLKR